MTTSKPRPPAAFRLDAEDIIVADADAGSTQGRPGARATIILEPEPAPFAAGAEIATPRARPRKGVHWAALFAAAIGGLLLLEIGLSVDRMIEDLFARAGWLGWIGAAFAILAVVALVALCLREIAGLSRLRRIERLRDDATLAAGRDDSAAARLVVADISRLYADRPELAPARALLARQSREIVDGRDLIVLAERDLIGPIEARARALVLDSAKRVTLVTAISPRAAVDLLFVLYENVRLLRRLSELYGGRPGTLGFLRLAGRVLGHLGITGGMALGDGLAQQLLGQGLAGRLSARLGEGVVNGLLTARIGLAALDLVRPLPRLKLPKPTLGDIVAELTQLGGDKQPPKS